MSIAKRPGIRLLELGAIILLILIAYPKVTKASRGTMAVGTLIIFIAIVLVAAIAAAVIISTGGSMQQKALITGNEAREGLSSGFEAVSIRGQDASQAGTPHRLTQIYVMGRLPAGSNILNLNNTVITYDSQAGTQTLTYGGVVADPSWSAGTADFVVTYMKSGPYHEDGYVDIGDMAKVKFTVDGYVGENTRGRITIIPQVGTPNTLEFLAPDSMTQPVEVLWPMS